MRVLGLLLLLGLASFSSAQVFGFGGCPRVRVARDFDLDRYFGRWFEITKFYTFYQDGLTCVSAEYRPGDDGSIRVINSGRSQEGEVTTIEGVAFQPDPEEGAKLQVQFFRVHTDASNVETTPTPTPNPGTDRPRPSEEPGTDRTTPPSEEPKTERHVQSEEPGPLTDHAIRGA
eukprot:XP_011680315.1 PREDICTED: apolipoprotein D-like [Strongylocentrotus purpuratus]